jgi:hypothetical protein
VNAEKYTLYDARRSDRQRGFPTSDLTIDLVKELIASGCSYCGDKSVRIGLDRIDNSKGHTSDNVVPCCMRCNLVRGSMPHGAWGVVAPGMRAAREAGLFGAWEGKTRKYKKSATPITPT